MIAKLVQKKKKLQYFMWKFMENMQNYVFIHEMLSLFNSLVGWDSIIYFHMTNNSLDNC